MFDQRLIRKALISIFALASFLLPPVSVAVEEDFSKEIEVNADNQSADGLAKYLHYVGNVSITQGSLRITADEVEIFTDKGIGKEIFIAIGQPATYEQKKKDGTIVKASAKRIEYHIETRILTLTGNAEFEQDSSKVQAETIRFDMLKEQVNAAKKKGETEQVTTIFQPAQKDDDEQQSDD